MKTNPIPGYLRGLFLLSLLLLPFMALSQDEKPKVFVMEVLSEIDPRTNRYTELALEEATEVGADHVLLVLNTFGGALNDADEIRKRILEYPKPVYVFINTNAASAGALISLACDSIYMAPGATIGAATVVDGQGQAAPGKYQSYMRSIMRSTAEANNRNPRLAEAMVEASVDSSLSAGQVLTLTTAEALKYDFADGVATDVEGVLEDLDLLHAEVITFQLSTTDQIISFFLNPFISGILLLVIIGGLYFELQSPGIGFPLLAAIVAGILYLVPYYLNGLAENWEVLLFIVGVILIMLEVFVIPGFGITGIGGILLVAASLVLVMVNNQSFDFTFVPSGNLTKSLLSVLLGMIGAGVLIALTWKRLLASQAMNHAVLRNTFHSNEGYRSSNTAVHLVGKTGVAHTRMAPSGRVMIDETLYDAQARDGFIEKGEAIQVVDQSTFSLRVKRVG
ncbi:membrane-bound serine protease (ClpP class) [Pontibacter ummariensis]|uniref:Membrane-bound serine protease (ClpP class) n=1 Tax=Pontibacter ummariensis TaxID=1610492 RepID=A0A239KPW0_9BACT|nr:NfeD family protein [Pontibacter ummariensis]PRY05381.1 membrane-bound serine protease (ClpP class) [Pontibacter ummariensis]SNT20201.1 membrane-bound serine protease (ClpP class) [Pontibacter ummariensis]